MIDAERLEFYWYRPPYPDDQLWEHIKGVARIKPVTPSDLLANTADANYFQCFDLLPLGPRTAESNLETDHQLDQALTTG